MLYMAILTAGPPDVRSPLTDDRRAGERRTTVERRCQVDRRATQRAACETPATYSNPEARTIKAAFAQGEQPICPRCCDALCIGPAVSMLDGELVHEVRCKACRRSVMVRQRR